MKIKFFAAIAMAAAIVGCNKEVGGDVTPSVEGQKAMIKVDLKAAGTLTKAYEAGSAAENAVSSVDFYFYDAAGNAYGVVAGSNSITWTPETPGAAVNVESVSDIVLVIKQSEVAPPSKIVAVLNSTEKYNEVSLSALGSKVVTALHTENTNFVMANSVYVDENNKAVVVAAEITQDNIFTTDDTAGEVGGAYTAPADVTITPVQIYVERVAAKVRVSELAKFPVLAADGETQMLDSEGNAVFAQLTGWNVTNATDEAYLVKGLNTEYTFDPAWTSWNAMADFRSFWANTTDTPEHKHTFTALEQHKVAADYYFENTGAEKSQVLVAARLVNQDGTNISLARWYNVLYTVADLKTAIVNTIASKLYVANGENAYKSVSVADVTFYQRAYTEADNRYEVLVKANEGVTYYKADGTAYTAEQVAAILEAIEPAQMWEEGMTYYFATINHLGGTAGIVRNHVYDITFTKVMGYGTPVYDPNEIIIPEYVDPQKALNITAQINVLSWNVVKNDVILGM